LSTGGVHVGLDTDRKPAKCEHERRSAFDLASEDHDGVFVICICAKCLAIAKVILKQKG
jgi:hypothetical protein